MSEINKPLSTLDAPIPDYTQPQHISPSSQKVSDIISLERTMLVITPNLELTLGELAEKLGDLYYDNLSEYLYMIGSNLARVTKSSEVKVKFLKASVSITKAREVCLPYMKDINQINPKHTKMLYEVFPEIVIERLLQLSLAHIKVFLFRLANKIYHDGMSDKARGRTKLSNHLFECSEILKEISLKL